MSNRKVRGTLSFVLKLAIVCLLVVCCNRYVVVRAVVDGDSMRTTLCDQDNLLSEQISYRFSSPKRFDVIAFYKTNKDSKYVKRIIGLPGETVEILDGNVYINGALLEGDSYCAEPIKNAGKAAFPILLGENQYFVLGDNRNNSLDSRFDEIGLVTRDHILGKIWCRLSPFTLL